MSLARPLRSLPGTTAAPSAPFVAFCGHCGKPPEGGIVPEVGSRVCVRCNLGLLLEAPSTIAPGANDAFLVVDRSLSVCAVSRRAERLLRLREVEAVDRPLTDLLVPADAELDPDRPQDLRALLVAAASGGDEPAVAVLRPVDEFGVRFEAKIGPCGPAPGALVVFDLG